MSISNAVAELEFDGVAPVASSCFARPPLITAFTFEFTRDMNLLRMSRCSAARVSSRAFCLRQVKPTNSRHRCRQPRDAVADDGHGMQGGGVAVVGQRLLRRAHCLPTRSLEAAVVVAAMAEATAAEAAMAERVEAVETAAAAAHAARAAAAAARATAAARAAAAAAAAAV